MEEMSIESMMGATVISIANIWEGPLAGDMFKGKVKTHTTLPEQWPEMDDNDNDFTEINYLNKQIMKTQIKASVFRIALLTILSLGILACFAA